MNVQSIPYNRALSTSRMLNALLDSFSNVSPYFAFDPSENQIWSRMIGLVDQREHSLPRQTLSDILVSQNTKFGADEKALASARDLAKEGTYTVMTGQQVGLFTGPLYTIYKALTAIKLAQRLEASTNCRIVPVFWMASDDHDFDEINHIFTTNENNEVTRLALTPDHPVDRRSAAHIAFGSGISSLIDAFSDSWQDTEHKEEILAFLHHSCTADTSLSDGFAALLSRLLHGTGMVLIDPTDPKLKKLMAPIFVQEINNPLKTTRSVLEAGENLASAGFSPQLTRADDAMNLFFCQNHQRAAMSYSEGMIHAQHADLQISVDDAVQLVQDSPESFSHNVITRPIVQDSLFPALAYVGGPSEIGYYAQLIDVYNQFDLPFPIVYPRSSMTIVESRVRKVIEKYELNVEDFFGNIHQVVGQRMQEEIPAELTETFRETGECIAGFYGRLTDQVGHIDITLKKVAEGAQRKAGFELAKLQDKTLQAVKRSHKTMRQQIDRSEAQLYPRNQLQERVYTIWPFINAHGFGFIGHLLDSMDESDFSHRVVTL
jgi:bacillithiol synthase